MIRDYDNTRELRKNGERRGFPDGLTFGTLRQGNIERLPEFRNPLGVSVHEQVDGSDWIPAQWLQAVVGELGEYANLRKKVERGDVTLEDARPKLADELADVVVYLDILAFQLGIDLSDAVIAKWNRKSVDVGSTLRINADGCWRVVVDDDD